MLISYKWIQEYFENELPNPKELSGILNTRAYEVESIKEVGDDFVIDIDVLPNRSHDSLCHRGIAKEISILTGLKFVDKTYDVYFGEKTNVEVEVLDENACHRYCAVEINNVEVKESPEKVVERLKTLGQRSINNVVDFANIVMFEIGQPLHAFDKDKVKGKIIVRNAKAGEKITTLDNKEVLLDESILIITDEEAPLAIAGIKGGKKAEVTKDTKNIILESANFSSSLIRKNGNKVNIKTDSSKRFENEVTPFLAKEGIVALADLILQNAKGEVGALVDIFPEQYQNEYQIEVSLFEINSLLGTNLNDKDIEIILNKLNFVYQKDDGDFVIEIPKERLDLRIKEEIIEEIGRIFGYENIEEKPIEDGKTESHIDAQYKIGMLIKESMKAFGFSEVMTSSFREKGDVATLKPVAEDKKYLRTNLSDSIKNVLDMNVHNADLLGLDFVKVYEIGKVFNNDVEDLHMCIGVLSNKIKKPKAVEILNEVINNLNSKFEFDIKEVKDGENIVEFLITKEMIDSDIISKMNFDISSSIKSYKTFSAYPFVLRDIAVWLPEDVTSEELLDILKENAGELLVNTKLFDEYKKDGKVSYAFRLVFQSMEKTLTDDEVNLVMDKVNVVLGERGWEVR